MKNKKIRDSNFELLRIFCMLSIVLGHFIEQSGIARHTGIFSALFYISADSLMRVSCSVFIIISAFFLSDKKFQSRRIINAWLAVAFYTISITLILKFLYPELVSRHNIYNAFFPVETSPLWFINYYIVLLCCTPVLNAFLNNSSKQSIEWILLGFFIFSSLYTTITGRLDFFAHDIWTFFFLYLLTGFIKKYSINFPKSIAFVVFSVFFIIITFLRTYNALHPHTQLFPHYLEIYRAMLMTVPNLVMAFSLFYLFKNIKLKNSRLINKVAGTTIGIYAFHQTPVFYPVLWQKIFHSTEFSANRIGALEYLYVIGIVIAVFSFGCIIEVTRSFISYNFFESRVFFKNVCDSIDSEINGEPLCKDNKTKFKYCYIKRVKFFVILLSALYFSLFTAYLKGIIQLPVHLTSIKYPLSTTLFFSKTNGATANKYCVSGFSDNEDNFTWTDGKEAKMQFSLEKSENLRATIQYGTFAPPQKCEVYAGKSKIAEFIANGDEEKTFAIPASSLNGKTLVVSFKFPDAKSPFELGLSGDTRKLALAIKTVIIEPTDNNDNKNYFGE